MQKLRFARTVAAAVGLACPGIVIPFSAGTRAAAGQGQTQTPAGPTAVQVYKNIQVLKDMPAWQLDAAMDST